jgi:hypothetical protein
MVETEATTEDQVNSYIHEDILEVEAGVVEPEWGRYMRVDWDNKIHNLHMAYVQVWAHGLHRYTVLAVVVVVGERSLVLA